MNVESLIETKFQLKILSLKAVHHPLMWHACLMKWLVISDSQMGRSCIKIHIWCVIVFRIIFFSLSWSRSVLASHEGKKLLRRQTWEKKHFCNIVTLLSVMLTISGARWIRPCPPGPCSFTTRNIQGIAWKKKECS